MKVTGTVEWKGASKFGGESIKVNGNYYNSKYAIKCNKDDVVEFDDGGKNYCQKLKVVSGGAPTPASKSEMSLTTSRERAIIRQNALGHATALVLATGDFSLENGATLIIEQARKFEEYASGDEDRAVGTTPANKDFNDE